MSTRTRQYGVTKTLSKLSEQAAHKRPAQQPEELRLRDEPPVAILQRAALTSAALRPADLLRLQRTLGNRAVGQLLYRPTTEAPAIQAKLTVNAPGDKYEQEADRVADQVMRMPVVQREALDEDKEPEIMTKCEQTHAADGTFEAGKEFERKLHASRGQGQPLPSDLRAEFETKFGADFGGVRIHADSRSAEMNQAIQARAFTHGQDIFFRSGQFDSVSFEGKRLLAHELTHVVQQQAGQVQNSLGSGMTVVQDEALEAEADQMRIQGVTPPTPVPIKTNVKTIQQSSQVIQRLRWDDLPRSLPVGGDTFNFDGPSYYWKGTSRGYENGNHFTLLGNGVVVKDIHYSIRFQPDPENSSRTLQVYTYYTVDGDAPDIQVTGRAIDKINEPDNKLYYSWRMYIEDQEGKSSVNGIEVKSMTWSQFKALPIGTLTIDNQINKFVAALNAAPKLEPPSESKTTGTVVKSLIGGTPVGGNLKTPEEPKKTKERKTQTSSKSKTPKEPVEYEVVEYVGTLGTSIGGNLKTPEEPKKTKGRKTQTSSKSKTPTKPAEYNVAEYAKSLGTPIGGNLMMPEKPIENLEALKKVAEELETKPEISEEIVEPGMLEKYLWQLMLLGSLSVLSTPILLTLLSSLL